MRLLHAGLLIAGAALAAGLAVKLTQLQPTPAVAPLPVPPPAPVEQLISQAPPALPAPRKPSPFVVRTAPSAPEVYVESLKPAIRKNEPILTAKAAPRVENAAPLFVPPVAYETPAPAPRRVTLQVGTIVPVRLNQSPSGDSFDAELAEPLVVDGLVIAERGARAGGRVVDTQLELTSISTSDGQRVAISTDPSAKRGDVVRFRVATRITITERRL